VEGRPVSRAGAWDHGEHGADPRRAPFAGAAESRVLGCLPVFAAACWETAMEEMLRSEQEEQL